MSFKTFYDVIYDYMFISSPTQHTHTHNTHRLVLNQQYKLSILYIDNSILSIQNILYFPLLFPLDFLCLECFFITPCLPPFLLSVSYLCFASQIKFFFLREALSDFPCGSGLSYVHVPLPWQLPCAFTE